MELGTWNTIGWSDQSSQWLVKVRINSRLNALKQALCIISQKSA
jgi:hypothetical protein